MDAQQVAKDAERYFETAKRTDGGSFLRTKDGTPDWVTDLIREAHDGMLPDDWRYDCIHAALEAIADGDEEGNDFADAYVDVYTSDLHAWLASNNTRSSYVDDAITEMGRSDRGIDGDIATGQYMEACEVFASVLQSCEEIADELTDQEDADALLEDSILDPQMSDDGKTAA